MPLPSSFGEWIALLTLAGTVIGWAGYLVWCLATVKQMMRESLRRHDGHDARLNQHERILTHHGRALSAWQGGGGQTELSFDEGS